MLNTKIIGNKIAEARKKMNLSQAELARQLFISSQAVGKWERGESMSDIVTFNRVSEILGVDLNYFSDGNAPAGAGPATEEAGVPGQAAQGEDTPSGNAERQLLTEFSASNLPKGDFAGITAHRMKFHASVLQGANFSGADLTGSQFSVSDLREADFSDTNLTDCVLSVTNCSDANFVQTILQRTAFNMSGLEGAKFSRVKLVDVKFTKLDLRKTLFQHCTFEGADFRYADLRGADLGGQVFTGVMFENCALNNASFVGATLRNVAFRASFALTNKYYKGIPTIRFDDAKMDKLTYAAFKGLGADLSKVSVI